MNTQTETLEFSVDSSIIKHLILSQAGTIAKGLCELVMNAVDAGTDSVHINIDREAQTLEVIDNGHGFRTREEVLKHFKTFGFDHTDHNRTFGAFGLGRGQILKFCHTHWRTHEFDFDVDFKNDGALWDLTSGLPHVDGLTVTGKFYEPLSALDFVQLVDDLEKMCKYCSTPVFVNGRQITKSPDSVSWTLVTDDAYVQLKEGYTLSIYNQGIFVQKIYSSKLGVAGTIVTKDGVNLRLNMARNDVDSDCEVWRRLKALCKAEGDKLRNKERNKRLTVSDRDYLAQQTVDPANIDNLQQQIFTLSDGRHRTFKQITDAIFRYGSPAVLTVAESGNRMAEKMMRDRLVVALSQATLERFGAASVAELVATLADRLSRSPYSANQWTAKRLLQAKWVERIEDCPGYRALQSQVIPRAQLSPTLRALQDSLQDMPRMISWALTRYDDRELSLRKLVIGRSADAQAYTDGSTYIAIVDSVAEEAVKSGLPGFTRIAHLVLHELLHDVEDTGSHSHDLDFMEAFHNVVLDEGEAIATAASNSFRSYCSSIKRISKKQAKQLDLATAAPLSVAS